MEINKPVCSPDADMRCVADACKHKFEKTDVVVDRAGDEGAEYAGEVTIAGPQGKRETEDHFKAVPPPLRHLYRPACTAHSYYSITTARRDRIVSGEVTRQRITYDRQPSPQFRDKQPGHHNHSIWG